MNMQEIKAIAKERGIKISNLKKRELVHEIQAAEGNEQCFDVGKSVECGQEECLWKYDCN